MEKELPTLWEKLVSNSPFIPFVINTVERFYEEEMATSPNIHAFYEIVYIKKGEGQYTISGKLLKVGPNDIVMIKSGQEHSFRSTSKSGCEFIVLYFSFITDIKKGYPSIPLGEFINFVNDLQSESFFKIKVSQKNDIIYVLNRIINERESAEKNDDNNSAAMIQILMMELFILVSRALKLEWENSVKSKNLKIKELIKITESYIQNNFERDLTLPEIAKYVYLSPSYFIKAFKEETGMSPINYLLKIRIDNAKSSLEKTNLKVSDIALGVGFSNQQRFNEMFRKFCGMSPLQYRKQVKFNSK